MTVKMGRAIDLEPLTRLEDKIHQLVGVVEQLRAEKAALVDENTRLQVQLEASQGRLEAAQAKLVEADQAGSELTTLRQERDQVRSRVADLLEQIEALQL